MWYLSVTLSRKRNTDVLEALFWGLGLFLLLLLMFLLKSLHFFHMFLLLLLMVLLLFRFFQLLLFLGSWFCKTGFMINFWML